MSINMKIKIARKFRECYIQPDFTGVAIRMEKAEFNLVGCVGVYSLHTFANGDLTKVRVGIQYYDAMRTDQRFYGR